LGHQPVSVTAKPLFFEVGFEAFEACSKTEATVQRQMPGETVANALPWRQAGCSPRRASPFFFFAKRRNQEKATPGMPPRCAGFPCRRALKRGAAKLAALRYAQTDAAPDPLQGPAPRRHTRGLHVKSNGNDNFNNNGNRKGNVNVNVNSNGNGNGNGRTPYSRSSPFPAHLERDGSQAQRSGRSRS
jgi:hypothetical protein